jgi:hypothetical protein
LPALSDSAQSIFFDNQVSTRYLRFDLKENYGDQYYTGLSEVKFSDVIPEPASLGLLGLVGGLLFVKKRLFIG